MYVTSYFHFIWQKNIKFIEYEYLSKIESFPQNEFIKTFANKSNMFLIIVKKNDINVFCFIFFFFINKFFKCCKT